MRITGDGGIGASGSGYRIHDFSGDVKAERLTVSLGAEIDGDARVRGGISIGSENVSVAQEPFTVRSFSSTTDPDVTSLLVGTLSGTLMQSLSSAQMVLQLRENDINDAFYVVSGGGNYTTDLTADTVLMRVRSNGVVSFPSHPTTALAATCHIDSSGNIFRSTSSIRYKREVEPLVHSSWIYELIPVTYIHNSDNEKYIGFIAEDVAEKEPLAAILNEDNQVENYSDRAIIAALVKEVQQLREEVDSLKGSSNG